MLQSDKIVTTLTRKTLKMALILYHGFFCVFLVACPLKNNTQTQQEVLSKKTLMKVDGLSVVGGRDALDSTDFMHVKATHAGWISLMPYAFARPDCTALWYDEPRQWQGEKKIGIMQSIHLAKQANLKIMLKPHLWISKGGFTGHYGFEEEQDWKAWEAEYQSYIMQYAQIADSLEVEMLCIGTELDRFVQARPTFWQNLIKEIRNVYQGKVTYAANWDEYPRVPFWAQLDYIGIDAYFPLTETERPTVEKLVKAWEKHIEPIRETTQKYDKPILFTEFGYQNIKGATIHPWEESREAMIDNQEQGIALEALFQAFHHQEWFLGGFLWKWFPKHEQAGGADHKGFTPQNKPAEDTIKKWYRKIHAE